MVALERPEPMSAYAQKLIISSQNLARDYQALNFAGAFADGAEFHVAIKFFRRIILDEAVAAVNLHGFIRDAHGDFARVKLRHARFLRDARVVIPRSDGAVGEPGGLIGQQPRRLDLRGHIRQLELNRLKFGDGFAELFALLRITHGAS